MKYTWAFVFLGILGMVPSCSTDEPTMIETWMSKPIACWYKFATYFMNTPEDKDVDTCVRSAMKLTDMSQLMKSMSQVGLQSLVEYATDKPTSAAGVLGNLAGLTAANAPNMMRNPFGLVFSMIANFARFANTTIPWDQMLPDLGNILLEKFPTVAGRDPYMGNITQSCKAVIDKYRDLFTICSGHS